MDKLGVYNWGYGAAEGYALGCGHACVSSNSKGNGWGCGSVDNYSRGNGDGEGYGNGFGAGNGDG